MQSALDFHVTFANPDFFKSDITSIMIGLEDSSNNTTPFKQANPAGSVNGVTPVFTDTNGGAAGGLVNGAPADCARVGQTRCDFLIQTDPASTFNTVPEPGTIVLLSFGLIGLGFASRRKSL